MFKDIIKYKDLLFMLTFRNIRIRYKQAVMGFLWAVFMPMVAILAGIVIKKAISIVSGKPMDLAGIVSISVKVLPWTFFISSIRFATNSLITNPALITKIYFPREVLPFSSILASLFDFFIASLTLSILLFVAHIGISVYIFWVPLILLFLILFTSGLSLILASANLFYRDIKYVVEIILMFGMFFVPIYYDAGTFGKYKTLLLLNPMSTILESMNSTIVLHRMPDLAWLSYTGIFSLLIFIFGMLNFHKNEPLFAENI